MYDITTKTSTFQFYSDKYVNKNTNKKKNSTWYGGVIVSTVIIQQNRFDR